MNRFKRIACLCLATVLAATLCGCWDYTGLDSVTIVAGMAIDPAEEDGGYLLSIETIDSSVSPKSGPLKTIIVQSKGKSLLDAMDNAEEKLSGKLFYANMQLVVINEAIARDEGVMQFVEALMRLPDSRETVIAAISREETARSIISEQGDDQTVIYSYEISKKIRENSRMLGQVEKVETYKAFELALRPGSAFLLPALRKNPDSDAQEAMLSGMAVIRDGKMHAALNTNQTRDHLLLTGQAKNARFSFFIDDEEQHPATIELAKCRARRSFDYEGGVLRFEIEISADCALTEIGQAADAKRDFEQIQRVAEARLRDELLALDAHAREELGADILGLGRSVEQQDVALWRQLEGNWDAVFAASELEVNVKLNLTNTGLI